MYTKVQTLLYNKSTTDIAYFGGKFVHLCCSVQDVCNLVDVGRR